jgi:hypothetical protein
MRFGFLSTLISVLTFIPTAEVRAQDKPVGVTEYYLGESKMALPTGQVVRTTLSLVKRVSDPMKSKIEEHVLAIYSKAPPKAYVVTFVVKGSTFTVSEKSKSFAGKGELVGEPWKWKAWKSETELPDGMGKVVSEDRVTEKGLCGKKTVTGPDGKVKYLFDDSLAPISAAAYEILYEQLGSQVEK